MRIRIPLIWGALKIKDYRNLRHTERDGRVPVLRLGGVYLIWSRGDQSEGRSL